MKHVSSASQSQTEFHVYDAIDWYNVWAEDLECWRSALIDWVLHHMTAVTEWTKIKSIRSEVKFFRCYLCCRLAFCPLTLRLLGIQLTPTLLQCILGHQDSADTRMALMDGKLSQLKMFLVLVCSLSLVTCVIKPFSGRSWEQQSDPETSLCWCEMLRCEDVFSLDCTDLNRIISRVLNEHWWRLNSSTDGLSQNKWRRRVTDVTLKHMRSAVLINLCSLWSTVFIKKISAAETLTSLSLSFRLHHLRRLMWVTLQIYE